MDERGTNREITVIAIWMTFAAIGVGTSIAFVVNHIF